MSGVAQWSSHANVASCLARLPQAVQLAARARARGAEAAQRADRGEDRRSSARRLRERERLQRDLAGRVGLAAVTTCHRSCVWRIRWITYAARGS